MKASMSEMVQEGYKNLAYHESHGCQCVVNTRLQPRGFNNTPSSYCWMNHCRESLALNHWLYSIHWRMCVSLILCCAAALAGIRQLPRFHESTGTELVETTTRSRSLDSGIHWIWFASLIILFRAMDLLGMANCSFKLPWWSDLGRFIRWVVVIRLLVTFSICYAAKSIFGWPAQTNDSKNKIQKVFTIVVLSPMLPRSWEQGWW